jgi:hypothetical protein
MTYTLTDNPAHCHRWHDWVAARTALEMFLRSHGESVRPEGRFEPAENGRGYVVRIYARHGRPVEDRIGWLREKRITSRRRKPEGAGDE